MGFLGAVSDFFGNGGNLNQPYQPPLNVQNFMQPVQVSEMQKIGILGDLVNAKQGYDNAYKQMNLWNRDLANPDLTDEQRKRISANVQGWKRERDAYAQAADSTRQTAAAIGVDLSDFDGDKTPAEAAQALQNYRSAGVKNFLNLPSVGDLERNRYMELRSQGASPRQAERIAGREREGMRDQLTRRYNDAFLTYGTNPDGSLTDLGLNLLGKLAETNPVQANIYGNAYATPMKVFDANQQQAVALMNNDAAMARQAAQLAANWRNAEAERQSRANLVDWSLTSKEKEGQRNRDLQEKLAVFNQLSRYEHGGNNRNGDNVTPFMKSVRDLAEIYKAKGDSDEIALSKAIDASIRHHYPEQVNETVEAMQKRAEAGVLMGLTGEDLVTYIRDGAGWKPKEASKATSVFNQLDTIYGYIIADDDDSAGQMLQQLNDYAAENQQEFWGQFNEDEREKFNEINKAYQEFLGVKDDLIKRSDMKDRAIAHYRAVKRGTKWEDEYTNLRRSRFDAKRNQPEQSANTEIKKANQNVRALLGNGDNNSNDSNKPVQTTPQNNTPPTNQVPGTWQPTGNQTWYYPNGVVYFPNK